MSGLPEFVLVFILTATCNFSEVYTDGVCNSPQYLELGKTGTIHCVFQEDFFGVYWYNTTDYENNDPIIHYNNIAKIGSGYESGEFDVHSDGSLIIRNVSLKHERVFTVAYVYTKEEGSLISEVKIIVFVKPEVQFPQINVCERTTNSCFYSDDLPIVCQVREVRPNVTLKWITRRVDGDEAIRNEIDIVRGQQFYTTRATITDVPQYSPLIMLLVCKASGSPMILHNHESAILYQRRKVELLHKTPILMYAEPNSKILLLCSDDTLGFLVWMKINSVNKTERDVLLYVVLIGEKYTDRNVDNVDLGPSGSLALTPVSQEHEGIYICIHGDGYKDGWITYDVKLRVTPTPSFPIVEGCKHENDCELEVEREGILTCKVKGIRPQIQLKWKTLHDSEKDSISFTDQQLIVTSNGETYDVSLTATYQVRDESLTRLTIECKEPRSDTLFHLRTELDLVFIDDSDQLKGGTFVLTPVWVILVIAVLIVIVTGVIATFKYKLKQGMRKIEITSDGDEMAQMLSVETHIAENVLDEKYQRLKGVFLKQIKGTYKDWYDAVQPIPYIRDKLYCVDKVFVEGGIEFLDSKDGTGGQTIWKKLEKYEEVFIASQVSSPRRILEGEPGYGKSTVSLQFAYDWCNPKPTSFLKHVEILILLRLSQLGGLSSIYEAIKQFILPRDTTINETDIMHILRDSKSVVFILDGFDEYPDRDSTTITDVIAIIARQMFQDFEVITTTRSSFLPKKYPPLTKRMRMTGFDDKARECYIRKAVVGDDDEGVRKIQGYLEDNPILSDLCQVPLLFVIFAHMTHENEQFRSLNSVTSFFRYMISGFHSHMRNKMDDENVPKYELFETDHGDLDKLAFEALSGKKQKIVWDKGYMCQLVGQEFYEQYVRIGILVEEESVDVIDDPGTPITEHVQYKTRVRFYHKLFCEWYAAHYLNEFLQQNPALNLSNFLENLDPFDVQYLYRFACGINSESGEKLIKYLQSIAGGGKFAILCILEQTGKIDKIKGTICKLCDEGVIISGHESLLVQRSSLQLLEIAAKNKIPLKYVSLNDCFLSVFKSGVDQSIKTKSGLIFTSRLPVEKLAVTFYNKEMTDDDVIDILEFSSLCSSLRHLRFGGSVPPMVIWNEKILSALQRNDTKVFWRLKKREAWYKLDLESGRWKNEMTGKVANAEKFQHLKSKFRTEMMDGSEDCHKDEIKEMRERLRRDALKKNSTIDGSNQDKK